MKWAALGIALAGVVAVLWLVLETRYATCVERAPVTYDVDSTVLGGGLSDEAGVKIRKVTATKDASACWHP